MDGQEIDRDSIDPNTTEDLIQLQTMLLKKVLNEIVFLTTEMMHIPIE
jgi:hypothetical protein